MNADQLWRFLLKRAEEVDGVLVCRASIAAELRRRGVHRRGVRRTLVSELEARGWVQRLRPPGGPLALFPPDGPRRRPGLIKADREATRRRIATLRRYLTRNVLNGNRFVCASFLECKRSIKPDVVFIEGQLSHVGKHYDLRRAGRPLRILFVGQEVGSRGEAHVTMDQRYQRVHTEFGIERRFRRDEDHPGRNPHARGFTLALRHALGLGLDTDREGEFIRLDGRDVHIFDCFALVNRLLCAAHLLGAAGQRTAEGKASGTMFGNCERHFLATLEILQPTLVVMEGKRVWKESRGSLPVVRELGDHLLECQLPGGRALVCTFTHPSARGPVRWDSPNSPYLHKIVVPTLTAALTHMKERR